MSQEDEFRKAQIAAQMAAMGDQGKGGPGIGPMRYPIQDQLNAQHSMRIEQMERTPYAYDPMCRLREALLIGIRDVIRLAHMGIESQLFWDRDTEDRALWQISDLIGKYDQSRLIAKVSV